MKDRLEYNVASVGSAFKRKRKVKVPSLPETIKKKSTFRAKTLRPGVGSDEGPSPETSKFPLLLQLVKEPIR